MSDYSAIGNITNSYAQEQNTSSIASTDCLLQLTF